VGNRFVDDMDLLVADDTKVQSSDSIAQSMQEGLDQWELGLQASGGALLANKSHWMLINFKWEGENWKYSSCTKQPANLKMNDYMSNCLILQRMEINQVEQMLGVCLVANGNMQAEYDFQISQAQTWAAQVATYIQS